MGGKALGIETVRLQKNDFLKLETEVLNILKERFNNIYTTVWYKSKETFGDLDVIVTRPVDDDILLWLADKFKSKKVVYNGESLNNAMSVSFEYQNFQIDLIFVHPDSLQIAHFYYSYNDLNNYVGRVAAQFGMKFGFNGLFYETIEEDILISRNAEEIYSFLGFNYQTYLKGFDTLEETFQFVIFSKYFNSDIYQYENLNHINKTRNQKRPNYQKFLDFLIKHNITGGYKYPDKKTAITMINEYFPKSDLIWKLQQAENKKIRAEKIKTILNSEIVKSVLNLNDWNEVRKVIDQIFIIQNIDMILVGLKENEIVKLIKAAYLKSREKQEFILNENVVFRSNDNHFINSKYVATDGNFLKLQTNDLLYYRIKKDRVRRQENWYDFKSVSLIEN